MDRVIIYRLDPAQPGLARHGEGTLPPGSGPRHMKFHPDGKHIYVLNELELTVTTFAYDPSSGTMAAIQTIPTVPVLEKKKETSVSASEIRVHPSGRFVYAANRGHDTITAFGVDKETGHLREIEREPIRGGWPRNFNIDPSGKWLLAAGRDSNTLAVFKIDDATGELTYIRQMISVPTPICVLFGSR
jgi:6-phosphogluconolactonase